MTAAIAHPEGMRTCPSLGVGYEKSAHTGKNRVNVSVIATTNEAISENKKNNTVLKAIGAIGLSPKQK